MPPLHRRLKDRGGVDPLLYPVEGAGVGAEDVVPLVVAAVSIQVVEQDAPGAAALGPPAPGDRPAVPGEMSVIYITFGPVRVSRQEQGV